MKHHTSRFWQLAIASAMLMTAVTVVHAQKAKKKPLKVFILAGQSNMQEMTRWQTLPGLADSPKTKYLYDKLVDGEGKIKNFDDIYVAKAGLEQLENGEKKVISRGYNLTKDVGGVKVDKVDADSKFGAELGFATTMREQLNEPILIVKVAFGGKSLWSDFRPPNVPVFLPPDAGHPEHKDYKATDNPIPTDFKLPPNVVIPEGRGKNCQIFQGKPMVINGVSTLYVSHVKNRVHLVSPFKTGDYIIGMNGQAVGSDPANRWRGLFFKLSRRIHDWKIKMTVFRPNPEGKLDANGMIKGEIKTFVIDVALTLEDKHAGIPAEMAMDHSAPKKLVGGGVYYWHAVNHIRNVLKDPGKFHPAYDPKAGYEIAGMVWFQGFNDRIANQIYLCGDRPRGFERYSYLLSHLIRNIRKEVKAPDMPFVIGVFGQGPVTPADKPDPFRQAMAAPASYPEFKGTVAAVETIQFRDLKIEEIKSLPKKIAAYKGNDPEHPYAKKLAEVEAYKKTLPPIPKRGRSRGQYLSSLQRKAYEIYLGKEAMDYLDQNVCERGFHYYGSPKFFVRAGEAFAKANVELMKKQEKK